MPRGKKQTRHANKPPVQTRVKTGERHGRGTAIPPWARRHAKILLIVLSLALLGYLVGQVKLDELMRALGGARLEWLGLALVASIAASFARVMRWKVLLDEKVRVGILTLFPIQLAGIAVSNFTPGKVGEPFKVVFLKGHGLDYPFTLLTVVWERLLDLSLLGLLSLGVVRGLGGESQELVLFALAGLFITLVILHYRLELIVAWLSEIRFLEFLREFETHHFSIIAVVGAVLGTIAIWTLDFVAVWAAFTSLGLNIDFLFLASAFSAAVILGIASFLPGGLGSTEAALVFFLGTSGYANPQLVAAILLARLVTIGFSSLLGVVLLPMAKRNGD